MTPPRVLGRARWRYIRHPGTDTAVLSETREGFLLSGRARIRFPEGPTALTYTIACDRAWRPRTSRIEERVGPERHSLQVEIREDGAWELDGFPRTELRGFTDFDLSASPSTNTLAVKRLDLPVGGEAEIKTGWVVFPDLEVRAVRQRYTRLSEDRYRYEGLHNGFVAEFGLDDLGFVTEYEGFWERIPTRRAARRATGKREPRQKRKRD